MKEQWYIIQKNEAYCADILDIFCGLHDYMITKMIYDYKNCKLQGVNVHFLSNNNVQFLSSGRLAVSV